MNISRWLFDESRLANSPSRQHGFDVEKEISYLQQVSNFIQDVGRKLCLPILCINTAVLFTQRFYVFHSLAKFEKFSIGAAALFLAAKVEENPRKVEHVSKATKLFVNREISDADYEKDLLCNEQVLLQTLGFDVHVQHPHQHVLKICGLCSVSKELAQFSYLLATYCLHLTRMCLTYTPTTIACVCFHSACKIQGWKVPISREGKEWFQYLDQTVTLDVLEELSKEFMERLLKCPPKYLNHEKLNKNLSGIQKAMVASSSPSSNKEGIVRSLTDDIQNFSSVLNLESTSRSQSNDELSDWYDNNKARASSSMFDAPVASSSKIQNIPATVSKPPPPQHPGVTKNQKTNALPHLATKTDHPVFEKKTPLKVLPPTPSLSHGHKKLGEIHHPSQQGGHYDPSQKMTPHPPRTSNVLPRTQTPVQHSLQMKSTTPQSQGSIHSKSHINRSHSERTPRTSYPTHQSSSERGGGSTHHIMKPPDKYVPELGTNRSSTGGIVSNRPPSFQPQRPAANIIETETVRALLHAEPPVTVNQPLYRYQPQSVNETTTNATQFLESRLSNNAETLDDNCIGNPETRTKKAEVLAKPIVGPSSSSDMGRPSDVRSLLKSSVDRNNRTIVHQPNIIPDKITKPVDSRPSDTNEQKSDVGEGFKPRDVPDIGTHHNQSSVRHEDSSRRKSGKTSEHHQSKRKSLVAEESTPNTKGSLKISFSKQADSWNVALKKDSKTKVPHDSTQASSLKISIPKSKLVGVLPWAATPAEDTLLTNVSRGNEEPPFKRSKTS